MSTTNFEERDAKSRLRRPYRPLHPTMPDATTTSPPWVPAVIDRLWRALSQCPPPARETLIARVLAWCNEGDPRQRAERVIVLSIAWGTEYFDLVLYDFLDHMYATKAGRRKGSKYRPFPSVSIPEEWPPLGTKGQP